MPTYVHVCVPATSIDYGTTTYISLAGGINSTEANVQAKVYASYECRNLYVYVTNNSLDASTTVAFRINGADGNMGLSIPSGSTGGFEDTSSTDSVSSGDLIDFRVSAGGTTGSIYIRPLSCFMDTADGDALLVTSWPYMSYDKERFCQLTDGGSYASSDAEARQKLYVDGTLEKFRAYVSTNTLNGSARIYCYINGVDNLVFSIASETTGEFESADSFSISAGDTVSFSLDTYLASTGGIVVSLFQSQFDVRYSTDGNLHGLEEVTYGYTRYYSIGGDLDDVSSSTESRVQIPIRTNADLIRARNLYVRIAENTTNGVSTVATRKNGSDGNLQVSIGASTTGVFEDTGGVDVLTDGDLYNYRLTAGGDSGSITPTIISVQIESVEIEKKVKATMRADPIPRIRSSFFPTLKL